MVSKTKTTLGKCIHSIPFGNQQQTTCFRQTQSLDGYYNGGTDSDHCHCRSNSQIHIRRTACQNSAHMSHHFGCHTRNERSVIFRTAQEESAKLHQNSADEKWRVHLQKH